MKKSAWKCHVLISSTQKDKTGVLEKQEGGCSWAGESSKYAWKLTSVEFYVLFLIPRKHVCIFFTMKISGQLHRK